MQTRRAHPLGLICNRGVWYLLAHTDHGQRTFRVSRIHAMVATTEPAERPGDFDLARAWHDAKGDLRSQAPARLEVLASMTPKEFDRLQVLPAGWRPMSELARSEDGSVTAMFSFPDEPSATRALAGMDVVVLSPQSVRAGLAAVGQRLLDRHATR